MKFGKGKFSSFERQYHLSQKIKIDPLVYTSCICINTVQYAEAFNELERPISALLHPGNTPASFEEVSQRWRAAGNAVSDLTDLRMELRPSASETNVFVTNEVNFPLPS